MKTEAAELQTLCNTYTSSICRPVPVVRTVTWMVTGFRIKYFNQDLSTTDVTKSGQLAGIYLKVSKVIATEINKLRI
jgi:hypothetical protein